MDRKRGQNSPTSETETQKTTLRRTADENQIRCRFMELFHKILKTAVAGGASDVHLKVGTSVVFRINRELLAIECPNLMQE